LAPATSDVYASVDIVGLRSLILPFVAMSQMGQAEIPPEVQRFMQAPNLMSAAELTFNLSNAGTSSLVVHANDAAAAGQLDAMIGDAIQMYQDAMNAQFTQQAASVDPVEKAFANYMQRISGSWTSALRPARNGASLTMFSFKSDPNSPQGQMTVAAVGGILVALLLPAVQAARMAARRNQSMNNMKQILLACLNHEAAKKMYPAHANYDANGRPLLSWRVHMLPYLDQEALYRQFHLDEPWDSEHNEQLIARMPEVFSSPMSAMPAGAGLTHYLSAVGAPCVMNGTAEGVRIAEITDGTARTIVLVEADQAVEWTKPDDWRFDPQTPNANLGGLHPGGFIAGFADGHIEFVSSMIDPQMLTAMFTRNSGEAINANMMGGMGMAQPVPAQPMVAPPPGGERAAAPMPGVRGGVAQQPDTGQKGQTDEAKAEEDFYKFFNMTVPPPPTGGERREMPEEGRRSGR
jgi:prepilin-type processing-associated H-X9-DG protein